MRSRIKTLKKIIKNEEKTLQKTLEDYKKQAIDIEFENKEIDAKIKEKEKVLNILFFLRL